MTTEKKKSRLEARISVEQKELILEAAKIKGCSLTDFIVNTVVEAAKKTIKEQEIMDLTKKDRLFFVSNILKPPPTTDKLKSSVQKYRQQIEE